MFWVYFWGPFYGARVSFEQTQGVDKQTDQKVQEALKRLPENTTSLGFWKRWEDF